MSILDAVTGVATAGSGIANTVLNFKNYNYMKDIQKEAWNREDNAVQRRAADLKAAGLSQTLAAGGGASSSAPINLKAPEISPGIGEAIPKAMSQAMIAAQMLKNKADIARTVADTEATKAQAENTRVQTAFMQENNPQRITKAGLENDRLAGTLESVISSAKSDAANKGFQVTMQETDRALARAKLNDAQWKNTLQTMRENQMFKDIDKTEQEIIAKKVAIELARLGVELSQRDLDIYKTQLKGVPSKHTPGSLATGSFFGTAFAEALQKAFNSKSPANPSGLTKDNYSYGGR